MKYTAVFTHVSEVDNLGRIDVAFELRDGSSIIYPALFVSGMASDIVRLVKDKSEELVLQIIEKSKIRVGDVINIAG